MAISKFPCRTGEQGLRLNFQEQYLNLCHKFSQIRKQLITATKRRHDSLCRGDFSVRNLTLRPNTGSTARGTREKRSFLFSGISLWAGIWVTVWHEYIFYAELKLLISASEEKDYGKLCPTPALKQEFSQPFPQMVVWKVNVSSHKHDFRTYTTIELFFSCVLIWNISSSYPGMVTSGYPKMR